MHRFTITTSRNAAWFRDVFLAEMLIMRPPFQRNPVWTDRQKAYLIDTILNEYPIPELYMQELVSEEGKQSYIVVDGQQRVRACLEFLEGKFALDAEDSPRWAEMTFDDLEPSDKKKVFEYAFVVRQLPEMLDEELRSIFVRLNRNNVVLNAQELRHATYWGPFIKTMEKLAEDRFWGQSGLFSTNDVRRMLDIEFISELTVALLHGPQNKKQTLDQWYAAYEKEFEELEEVRDTFRVVLGEITQILPKLSKTRWRKKSDFYTLFLVLAANKAKLPLATDKRARLQEMLMEFGEQVTSLLKDITQSEGYLPEVIEYSLNVERSASDLANRRRRFDQLSKSLGEVFAAEAIQLSEAD